jgi:site-specific DNA recombinase
MLFTLQRFYCILNNAGGMNMDVGIWVRVSRADEESGETVANHRERAIFYAKAYGWNVVESYNLPGVSGKTVLDHSEARRMIADVRSGRIKGLLFSRLARLARNTRELLYIADLFKEHGADLISLEEKIDTTSNAGRLLFTLMAALAEWERAEIASRVASAVPGRARAGKPTGGRGPYGYRWKNEKLVPNPDEVPVVRRAYELCLETGRIKTTVKKLNAEGFSARRGPWTTTTLRRILTDSVYCGVKIANYSRSRGDKKSWVLKPENEWIRTSVDPIVDQETWSKVQVMIGKLPGRTQKRTPKEGRYLFGGLLTCECGTKLYVIPYKGMSGNRYVCRNCKNKVDEDDVLSVLRKALRDMVLSPERLACKDFPDEDGDLKKRIGVLKKDLKTVQGRIKKAHELYAAGKIDQKGFSERYDPLREQQETIEKELPRLQMEIDSAEVKRNSREYVIRQAETFSQMWDKLNESQKRELARKLVAGATVGRDQVELAFRYMPEFTPPCNEIHMGRGSSPPRA